MNPFNPLVSIIENRSRSAGGIPFAEIIERIRCEKYAKQIKRVRELAGLVLTRRAEERALKMPS